MRITFVAVALFLASGIPAYAYLDPGTGSMVLQAIIAAIAAAGATSAMYWAKVRVFFGRLFRRRHNV